MEKENVLTVDFKNRRIIFCNEDDSSDRHESPCAGGTASGRTIDDVALETRNKDNIDFGVRIREYAITPGRVLQTLGMVTEDIETTDDPPRMAK